MPSGVVLEADGLYVYSEEDIFGEPRAQRRIAPRAKGALLNLEELRPGDVVVHIDHGIGQYRGLKHMKVADIEGDFLNLEYAGNDTMYVPVERINLVQRYIGGDGNSSPSSTSSAAAHGRRSSAAPRSRCSRWRASCSISTPRAK